MPSRGLERIGSSSRTASRPSYGARFTAISDACHNAIVPKVWNGEPCWLHRKGAAPADEGPLVIPGSRGSMSYLVEPMGHQAPNGYSLAHGAGRKWTRSAARDRLGSKYRAKDLTRTSLKSRVICEDKALLFEEAPEAYKKIDDVIGDLVELGLVRVLATLKPLITYKVRRA